MNVRMMQRRNNWPPGVKAVYGFPRGARREAGRGASEIQSLLFEKSKWTPSKAKDWLVHHGFLYGKMDPGGERADYYHFRQTSPRGFARMRVSTNPSSKREKIISVWFDSQYEDPAESWIVSLDDSQTGTTYTLDTFASKVAAVRYGREEARHTGLQLVVSDIKDDKR